MKYANISYETFKVEAELLRQIHYLEVVAHRGQGYGMDHDFYESAEDKYRIIAAYDDTDTIVGYHTALVFENPHDAGALIVASDLFFLHPDHRRGRAGLELLKVARADMTSYAPGALWRSSCPIDGPRDIGQVLERGLGMTPTERVYEVRLADPES